jgi:hypothetical protein
LRWHPGIVFVLRGAPFGVLAFAAGIQVLPSRFERRSLVFWPVRWHPRFAFVLEASPLCGAAPTFLCRRKEK